MKNKNEAGDGLQNFTDDLGTPVAIIRYNAGEQTGHNTEFMKFINKYHISDRTLEPYPPWNNLAENFIGEVKGKCSQRIVKTKATVGLRFNI